MPEVTRRRLLGSAAASAGGAFAAAMLPPNLRQALAAGPQRGSLRDVKHVVIHMQENRSFDHYFGTLAGVRGFGDPNVLIQDNSLPTNGKPVFYQYDPDNTAGGSYLLPWHLDTKTTSSQAIPSTSHAWTVQHSAVDIVTQGSGNVTLNDNWLPAHLSADGIAHGPYTMSYYERDDIPFHFALAESFTLCDGYHCSLLGPTWPNRMYLMTGMIDPLGTGGGPIISNVVPSPTTGKPYTWKTYPEALTEAGISWRIYQEEDDYGTNMMEFFQQYQDATPGSPLYGGLTIYPPDRFEWDALNGKLPTVSWIIPTSGQSEHPAYLPASGADFLASKLDAVAANRDLWSKTVYIINYDENDGLFDHVPPPLPPPGTEAEFVDGVPIGGGVRVPCFIVSPWSIGGYVATENFDHTSVLQFLETLTGVPAVNVTDWRRQTFGDLTSALGFSNGKRTTFPQLPQTLPEFWQAESEVATLPAATIPTTNQTPPVQDTRRPALPWTPQSRSRIKRRAAQALPATASRVVENRTTHRSDFVNGASDKVFMAKVAAVEGKAVDTSGDPVLVYVPGIVGGNVAIFNGSTFKMVSAVSGSTTNPYGVAATPDGSTVLVTESGTNTVSVIPTGGSSANKVAGTIVVGIYPHGVVVSPDGSTAYVANTGPNTGPGGSQTVSVIDIASSAVTGILTVGEAPQVLSVNSQGDQLFVACADGVYAVALGGGQARRARVELRNPHGVTISPDGSSAYVTDSEQHRVVVLDTASLRAEAVARVGHTPWNTAFSADGSSAYVTNANDNTVSVIDTTNHRVTDKIALGGSAGGQLNQIPTAIALSPDGNLWVACNASSSLVVIDPSSNAVIESLDIGLGDVPTGLAFVTM